MQQTRKTKPAARSRMTDGKPRRTRRSAEQMLVELKQRLQEISDLNAAGSVLNWDQATYMPQAGAGCPRSSARDAMQSGARAGGGSGARRVTRLARSIWREPAIRFRRREPDPCRTP